MRTLLMISRPGNGMAKLRCIAVITLVTVFANLTSLNAGPVAQAQQSGDATEIRSTMDAQVAAWNKGDIETFMKSYDNSPETTFVGATSVNKGYDKVLARYKKNYGTPGLMGRLNFNDLDVRLLPSTSGKPEYAVVTGKFHLQRTEHNSTGPAAASRDEGIFSLVLHRTNNGWKIILDHTA